MSKCVDRFHFPTHKVTDSYCQQNCNPNIELEKLGLKNINTQSSEQAFHWLNSYKNVKSMNEARFKFFLLYIIDLHNFKVMDNVKATNPMIKRVNRVEFDEKKLMLF